MRTDQVSQPHAVMVSTLGTRIGGVVATTRRVAHRRPTHITRWTWSCRATCPCSSTLTTSSQSSSRAWRRCLPCCGWWQVRVGAPCHAGQLRRAAALPPPAPKQRLSLRRHWLCANAGTRKHLSTADRVVAAWFTVTGLIHLVIEGETSRQHAHAAVSQLVLQPLLPAIGSSSSSRRKMEWQLRPACCSVGRQQLQSLWQHFCRYLPAVWRRRK